MASIKVSDLTATTSTAADSFLYVADTTNGGVDFDSKKITVANFLNAYATEAFVSTQISELINGAPEALNTLKEISDVIGDSNDVVGNLISMIDANETHVDNVATLTGVAKDSADMGSFSGSTIADSSTIKSALQALETSLETKGAATDLSGVISNTGDLVTLSGVAAGSVNLGVFDGDTLSDNATLKVVLQDAEDAIEANASAITSEVSDRAAAITALTNGAVASNTAAINQEVTDRNAAITALTNGDVANNAAGIVTNAAAITSLTNGAVASNSAAIVQEVSDRVAAVSAEATARENADALLMPKTGGTFTGAISGPAPSADSHLATKKYADDLVANVDLSQVETNRVDIAAETSARTSADTALSNRLDTLEADPTTATALQAEASTRASADTALSNRVTSLEADPTTQTLLNAETTARTSADTALSNRLDTLEADPTTQTLLDAETAARIAGDALNLPLAGGTMTGAINLGAGSSTYTSNVATTADSTGFLESFIFNGTVSETVNFRFNSSSAPHYVSFSPLTVTSSLRIHVDTSTSGISLNVDQGPAYTVNFTENNGDTNNDGPAWVTLPVTTPFTLTSIGRDAGHANWFHLGSIEVDGVLIEEGVTVGGGAASVLGVDGTATFGGAITASAVPTDDAHLVNKLYADNLVAGVDLSGIATNAAAIEALTNGAPDLLNTLNEIANAIGDDENFATTITNQISAESTTRASADTALSGRLDVLEADPTTATALNSEASTRATADTALSNRLDTLEADPTTQTLLNAETTARTSADSALSGRLDTLEADPTTQTLLTAEATTRAAADTALSGRLDTLEADPTTATAVTNAIAVETAARQAADALLLPLAGGTMSGAVTFGSGGGSTDPNAPSAVGGTWDSSTLTNQTLENSGRTVNVTSDGWKSVFSTVAIQPNTGLYYWEAQNTGGASITDSDFSIGLSDDNLNYDSAENDPNDVKIYMGGDNATGFIFRSGVTVGTFETHTKGEIIGLLYDTATGELKVYYDGVLKVTTNVPNYSNEKYISVTAGVTGTNVTASFEAGDLSSYAPALGASAPTTSIGVDGTASFGANVTASAVPTADAHLVNKLYADQLVANVDLSQVETNRLAIIQEINDRAAAITALTNGAVASNTAAINQEVTDRAAAITALTNGAVADNAAAITALTNGQVATNTSGIASNATAITNLTNGAVADNAAAITALTNGAVASNTAAINQEVTDRQAAVAALTNGAVADNAAAITALTNGAVADNAAAVVQEAADRVAADALKVDKQSLVNEHMLGQTSAQSAPVDAQGNSNYLFLVVDKATGALKSIDKTFLEAE